MFRPSMMGLGSEASEAVGTLAAEPSAATTGGRGGMGDLPSLPSVQSSGGGLGVSSSMASVGGASRAGSLAPMQSQSSFSGAAKNAPFIGDTANRLLATERPESVHRRLEGKARDVAAAVALGAPETFGGVGGEDGKKGSSAAPNPTLPVTVMMPKVEVGLGLITTLFCSQNTN
jgi:hypothetical protein